MGIKTCDGSGYGYGSGYGDGYGSGSGYGYGSGYGDGSGYGSGSQPRIQYLIPKQYKNERGVIVFWKSNKDGKPCNGGTGSSAYPGKVEEVSGPLQLCGNKALHATLNPAKWTGSRLWLVALHGEVAKESDKVGALKREILCEISSDKNAKTFN